MKTLIALLALVLTSSVASGEIYTWRDGKGTRFYTNSLHEIPARYLKKAKVLDVATGKAGGPATASAGAAGAPVAQEAPFQPQPQQVQLAPPASVTRPAPPASSVAAPAVTRAARGSTVEGARPQRQISEKRRAMRRRNRASDE